MNAVETQGLTKVYRERRGRPTLRAVDDLGIQIPQGDVVGLLGPNGAGKTTTLGMMLGLLRPTAGAGTVLGLPLGDWRARARIGYLPEAISLPRYYDAQGLLHYYGRLFGLDGSELRRRINEVLQQVGLAELAWKRISKLSQGQIQRLGWAQVILNRPALLVLDEPTSNLDPLGRQDMRGVVEEMKAAGSTVLISSHILSEIESICDSAIILRRGKVVTGGPLRTLLQRGQGRRVRLRDLGGEVLAEALRLGAKALPEEDGSIVLEVNDQAREEALLALLSRYGCQIIATERPSTSLESAFVDLLKEEGDDHLDYRSGRPQ